jgi:transglutaminase-like putative cysteine protease
VWIAVSSDRKFDKILKHKNYAGVALLFAMVIVASAAAQYFRNRNVPLRNGCAHVMGRPLSRAISYYLDIAADSGTGDFTIVYFKPTDTVNQRSNSEGTSVVASKLLSYEERTISVGSNKLAVLHFENILEQNKIKITYTVNVNVEGAIIELERSPQKENVSIYSSKENEAHILPSNPRITALADSLLDKGGSRIETIINIHNWVRNYIAYETTPLGRQNAIETLDKGSGDCDDKAVLEVSMLRAENIPSRIVVGLWGGDTNELSLFHAWAEIYTDYGWVPSDPTSASLSAGELTTNHIRVYHETNSRVKAEDIGIYDNDANYVDLGPLIRLFWRGGKQPIVDWRICFS